MCLKASLTAKLDNRPMNTNDVLYLVLVLTSAFAFAATLIWVSRRH